jgi:hypothetical protein
MKTMMRLAAAAAVLNLMTAACVFAQVTPRPTPQPGASSMASLGSSGSVSRVNVSVPSGRGFSFDAFSNTGSAGSVLVVPAGEISIEDLAAANEDMTVMAQIFQNALRQANLALGGHSVGVILPMLGQRLTSAESIYLQGYGALFTINVSFPLAPGPKAEETPEQQPETDVDPVWDATRRNLFEPPQAGHKHGSDEEREPYSAEKVDNLKTTLITALKHAANIRGLAPDEAVVITITGQAVSDKITKIKSPRGTKGVVVVEKSGASQVFEGGVPEEVVRAAPTMLMIRARASDISAYAKGDRTLEQFRQNVQVRAYPYLGDGSGSGYKGVLSTGSAFSR